MISIPGTEMDFGDMKYGKSYTKDFIITNNDNKPLLIKELGKSCTCTNVVMDNNLIPAKGKGTVRVTVTPGSTGLFLRSFWFVAGSRGATTIKLKGKVT